MIICINGENISKYETFKEMFNELTKDGSVVSDLNDGNFILNKKEEKKEIQFFRPDILNTKNDLEEEVIEFRNTLRSNLKSLIDSGIDIPKEEKEKLASKFEFIKHIK